MLLLFLVQKSTLCFRHMLSPAGHFRNYNVPFLNCKGFMLPSQHWIYKAASSKKVLMCFSLLFFQVIHAELSKLVKRQSGGKDTQEWRAKPAEMLGDNIAPFLIPSKKKPSVSTDSYV